MKEKDLTKILIPDYKVKAGEYRRPKREIEVLGWDSETYRGKITLLTNSLGEYLIPDSLDDILDFLNKKRYRSVYNFFFNLEYDTNAFLKFFSHEDLKNFIELNQTIYKQYKIRIIPQKFMSIKALDYATLKFFDISQFYHIGSLEKTYEEVFNVPYVKRIQDRSKGFKKSEITPDVIQYCIEDSKACKDLAQNFVTLTNSLIYVPRYISPASVSKAFMKTKMREDYKFTPSILQQFALNSYQGGRFECLRRGYFDKIYIYDINSCYPDIMSNLPEPKGRILKNSEYCSESLYSYFKVDMSLDIEDKISPMKYFFPKKNLMVYPVGKFKDMFLTKSEYELLNKYDCKINIKEAYHLINDEPYYPYHWIKEIYSKRMQLKEENNSLEHILKLILNSAYGIHIQLNKIPFLKEKWTVKEEKDINNELIILGKKLYLKTQNWLAGQFFNPVIATEITARARVKLVEDSYKYSDNVIMFATDSITLDKKIPLTLSSELGDYEIENKGFSYGVILGNGVYQIISEDKEKKRFRGFSKNYDLMKILKNNGKRKMIKLKRHKPLKLKESRTKLELLNEFFDMEKVLNINSDSKRIWNRAFNNGEDVLSNQIDSKPLKVSI